MTSTNGWKLALVVLTAIAISACSSTPVTTATIAEDKLRDADMDLLFATEFPVADKTDGMTRAADAWSSGDIDHALYFYVKALQFDPQDTDLLATIGRIHQMQKRPDMAVRAYSMALSVDPDHVASLEGRGLILVANDRDDMAEVDLTRVIELAPGIWSAHNGLGMLADRRGDHLIARMYYDAALALVPNSAIVLNNRGYSSFLAGQFDEAVDDLHVAASEHGYEQAWMNLGLVYSRQGKYIPAVEMYRKVLDEAETYNKVAEAAIANEDYEAARKLLNHAIYESPTYFPAAEENLTKLSLLEQ